jgi:phosphomevalonate kinase
VLGEYAVLDGATALVMAVNRYCRAHIEPSSHRQCDLQTIAAGTETFRFDADESAGSAIVDVVRGAATRPPPPWSARLDSSEFYSGQNKLGIGSSAAALVAWAGAWAAYCGADTVPTVPDLVALHRRFQGGAGSGLDVAAALTGGAISYRLDEAGMPHIGSVRLPNSVGFAGVFAGHSASTPDFVAHYRRWAAEQPENAAGLQRSMGEIAAQGLAAAGDDDGEAFLIAVAEYGRCLDALGQAMEVDILTPGHRAIGDEADNFGVAYKVSGAGGGDLGLAFARDPDALAAFTARTAERGFQVVNLAIDEQGLVVEEQAE